VPVEFDSKFEFRTDAIGAGDQHGLVVTISWQLETAAKSTQLAQQSWPRGLARDWFNSPY
jgi:hypothetical protein